MLITHLSSGMTQNCLLELDTNNKVYMVGNASYYLLLTSKIIKDTTRYVYKNMYTHKECRVFNQLKLYYTIYLISLSLYSNIIKRCK